MAIAPQRTGEGSPSVVVEPGSHAPAGTAAVLRVHARNVTAHPQDLTFSALGLEGTWLPAPVRVPAVPAGATVTVELAPTPPVGAAAGDYAFVVLVQASGVGGAATTLADASLRVDGATELVLTVEPADSRGLRGHALHVVLANTGPSPVTVDVTTTAEPGAQVRVGAGGVEVGPHQSVRLGGRVRATRPRLVGTPRRLPFEVTATGSRAPQRVAGTFTQRPLLTPGAMRAVAIVAVAAIWVAGVVAVLPWVSDRFSADKQTSAGQQTAPAGGGTQGGTQGGGTGGSGGSDGSGGTGGSGGSGGTGGSGGDGGPGSAGAEGVRVAGVVTGTDPSGVTVQVQPASALAAQGSDGAAAGDAGGIELTAAHGTVRLAAARSTDAAPAGKVSSLALPVERGDEAPKRLTTVTGADGTWAFAGLSATGRYLVVLAKPGYQTQRFLVTGAQAAAAPLKLAMQPGQGSMSGLVTGPGGPAGGVQITLSDGTTTVTTRTATSGQKGRWEVEGLSTPSTYLVTASSPTLGTQSELVRLGAAGSRTVDLPLRAGVTTLSGTVRGTDALGGVGGLGGLTVTASDGTTTRTATTVTGDRAGSFVLADLPVPATYTLTVSGAGYATQTRSLRLTAAGLPSLDITMLLTGGTVDGTVTEPGGAPIAGAGLTLAGPAGTYKTMSASDAQGSFRFSGIAPGDYVLTATVFAHVTASAQVTVKSGGTVSADLSLTRLLGGGLTSSSYVVGRVTDATTGAKITCPHLLASEQCVVTVTSPQIRGTATSDPDTQYQIPGKLEQGLLPGRYSLTVSAPGYEPGHVDVTVAMGQTVEAATVALVPSPSITGIVLARVGSVPTATCVVAIPAGSAVTVPAPCDVPTSGALTCHTTDDLPCAFLGTNGSYTIDRLAAGAYDVVVVPPADAEYVAPDAQLVTLAPGDVRRYDVTLDRLGVLNVTIQRSDGRGGLGPENNAVVTLTGDDPSHTATGTTSTTGTAQVRGLAPDTYTVSATPSTGGANSPSVQVVVGLNQDVAAQLVLTPNIAPVQGKVLTVVSSTAQSPVDGATVKITGVTGYVGATPTRATATAVTTPNGLFSVCTVADDCDPADTPLDPAHRHSINLRLVEQDVDVQVSAPGYQTLVQTDVPLSTLPSLILEPAGVTFHGSVAFDPTGPSPVPPVTLTVTDRPAGTGDLRPALDAASGQVVWFDSSQPTDGAAIGSLTPRKIRPGLYTVVASAPGYSSDSQTFTVDVTTGLTAPVTWTLRQDGALTVRLLDGTAAVTGAVVTLHEKDGTTTRKVADPGANTIAFGSRPTGTYAIEVHAPGYDTATTDVVVGAGATAPIDVQLTKLASVHGTVVSVLDEATIWTVALPGATVTATKAGGAPKFSATTDSSGEYTITGDATTPGLSAGTWNVGATAAGYQAPAATPVAVAGSSDVPVATIGMAPVRGNLTVTVKDGTTAVPGLQLSLTYQDATGHQLAIPPSCGTTCAGGTYTFTDLLPLTYTLMISGGNYASLAMPVTVPAGSTLPLSVPITAPHGSLQGVVSRQQVGSSAVVVPGATVALDPVDAAVTAPADLTTDTNGRYTFGDLVPGDYTVTVTLPAGEGGGTAVRHVTITPGQGIALDVVVQDQARQLQVTVTSANGTDLTGAVVSLAATGLVAPAPQPLVRTAAGASTYTTTFNQVGLGSWTATVSGPSGHLGTVSKPVTVGASDGSGDAVTLAMSVAETRVALRVTSSLTSPPSTLPVKVTPAGSSATTVTAFVGGGDTVVYVPMGGATVAVDATSGYSVVASGGSIGASATNAVVSITIGGVATTTTASASATTLTWGDTGHLTATVSAGAGGQGGTFQLQRRVSGVWQDEGDAVDATASATIDVEPVEAWGTGSVSLRVQFSGASSGSGAWAASTSNTLTFTIQRPTTTTLSFAYASGTSGSGTLTATITAPGGTAGAPTGRVAFSVGGSNISGCGNVNVSSTAPYTATCPWTPPAPTGTATSRTTSVTASFAGSGGFVDSQDTLAVTSS
jgi:hypothetical protein